VGGRAIISLFAFAMGLFGAGSLLRLAHPPPLPFEVLLKEDALTNGQFDTVFIGSSRVYRHIIPAVFDERMRRFGVETKSFNYGFDGMRPPESLYYATRLLSEQRQPLKWVFVELCPIFTGLNQRNAVGARTLEWHDASNTLLVLRENSHTPQLWPDRLLLDGLHLESFFLRETDVGGGRDLLLAFSLDRSKLEKVPAEWREQAGFCADQRQPAAGQKLARVEAALENAAAAHFRPRPAAQNLCGPLRELTERILRSGARPIFVVMPTIYPQENLGGLRSEGVDADVISLADGARFPELYLPEFRADADHLIGQGPKLLTADLAREFARVLGKSGQDGFRGGWRREESEDEEIEESEQQMRR
jgi:hypothetical protein